MQPKKNHLMPQMAQSNFSAMRPMKDRNVGAETGHAVGITQERSAVLAMQGMGKSARPKAKKQRA